MPMKIEKETLPKQQQPLQTPPPPPLFSNYNHYYSKISFSNAADDGRFFGLGEMGEREIVGREMRERDILVSKVFLWLMLIEVCLGS